MIYLLDGTETYQLSRKKQELLSKVSADSVISIDASKKPSFSFSEVIQKCSMVSLFSDRRVVILDQPYFLKHSSESGGLKNKKPNEDINELLIQYCTQPNPDTDLIFYCFGYDCDKRTKETKTLLSFHGKTVTHIHFGELSIWELEQLLDNELKRHGYSITKDAREEFLMRIAGSATELYRAFDILDLYGELHLSIDVIRHLIPLNTEVEIWSLTNAFIAGDMKKTFQAIRDLTILNKNTHQSLIIILAASLKKLYHVLVLFESGYDVRQIERMLGIYRADKMIQNANGKRALEVLEYLNQLAELDQGIKRGTVNDKEGFEHFLIRNLKSCNQ